jgi:hypothetical protein
VILVTSVIDQILFTPKLTDVQILRAGVCMGRGGPAFYLKLTELISLTQDLKFMLTTE